MIGDRHLHSHFSFDGSEKTEDILRKAIELGMKEICITDHCDIDMGPDWYMPVEAYAKEMERLKAEYADRIELHIGIEMGLNPDYNDQIDQVLDSYPFELVIGSIHTMLGEDPYYRDKFDMDDGTFYRIYFETALERLKKSKNMDVFGHLDYIVRYGIHKENGYDPLTYADLIEEILKELVSRGIALELNTAGLRKGVGFVHPHPLILKRYRELGGHLISVGSDAHTVPDIGSGFAEAEKIIKEFGFSEKDIVPYRR